jgi:LPS sulfotransferase NodH
MGTEPAARKPYDLATSAHDFAPWSGPPKRSILICTHPRSGSTLLGETIYFARGLGCPLEYFHAGFRPGLAQRWSAPDIYAYVAAVHAHRTESNGVLSVKLFWRDIVDIVRERAPDFAADWEHRLPRETPAEIYREAAAVIADIFPNPQFIHLFRRDRVRQAVSALAATQTGLWRAIPGVGEQVPIGPPEYDYQRVANLIAYQDFCHGHWRNYFAALGQEPHALDYEALTQDLPGTVKSVFAFLGKPDADLPPVRMQRQSDARNESMVLRFLRDHAGALQSSG